MRRERQSIFVSLARQCVSSTIAIKREDWARITRDERLIYAVVFEIRNNLVLVIFISIAKTYM